jgi:uroporphyrinogen-III synthase
VRRLWIAFNNYSLYGESHPLTSRGIDDCAAALREGLDTVSMVTLHLEQDFIACEEWRLDKRAYGPRLVARLKDAKVQSLTFYRQLERSDIAVLLEMLADSSEYPSVDRMAEAIASRKAKALRFNYVTYQKVTMDESIVQRDLHRFAELLGQSAGDSPHGASSALGAPSHIQAQSPSTILTHVRAIRQAVGGGGASSLPPVEEIVESLAALRKSVFEDLRRQAAGGAAGEISEDVFSEVESLTADVIVRIVKEEYRGENMTIRQLAMLIRRLLPDVRELRRMLPLLKKALLEAGMGLDDYLRLVRELERELRDQGIGDVLIATAGELGVSSDEIVESLRTDPRTAVSLILLAAEIKSRGFEDDAAFAASIDEYIGRISQALREPRESAAEDHSGLSTTSALAALEEEFGKRLASGQEPAHVRESVMAALTQNGVFAVGGGDDEPGGASADGDANAAAAVSHMSSDSATAPDQASDFIERLRQRGVSERHLAGLDELIADLSAALGGDPALLRPMLDEYVHAAGACIANEDAIVADAAIDGAMAGIERRLVALRDERSLDPADIAAISRRLQEHIRALASPEKDAPGEATVTAAGGAVPGGTGAGADLDAALSLKGYSPADIGRFSALADEMRQMLGEGLQDTQATIAGFIETMGDTPALDPRWRTEESNSGALDAAMARIERDFLSYLGARGLPDTQIAAIGEALAHRLAELMVAPGAMRDEHSPLAAALRARGYAEKDLARFLALSEEMSRDLGPALEETRDILAEFISRDDHLDEWKQAAETSADIETVDAILARLEEEFLSFLQRKGIDHQRLASIGTQLSARLAHLLIKPETAESAAAADQGQPVAATDTSPRQARRAPLQKKRSQRLSGEIMRPKDTRALLEREIARCARYGCSFSCLSFSVEATRDDLTEREPVAAELAPVLNALRERLAASLRTPDVIGSTGSAAKNHILVVLPMTDAAGAEIVARRLDDSLRDFSAPGEQQPLRARIAVSAESFTGDKPIQVSSFLRRIKATHARARQDANVIESPPQTSE